ncbi:MAG: hypothetical protein MJ252_03005 [archaeon]|nr:hypothetical protein [archaeon]
MMNLNESQENNIDRNINSYLPSNILSEIQENGINEKEANELIFTDDEEDEEEIEDVNKN